MVTLALCVAAPLGAAVFEPREFNSPEVEAEYRQLTFELRCLVCQNQNIADSDADLAQDLRREVYERLQRGESRSDIVDFMTARYGDFVLYRPPLRPGTIALWGAPLLLVVAGCLVAMRTFGRRATPTAPLSADEQTRLSRHLDQ